MESFSPSSISGLLAWFKADENSSLTFHDNYQMERNDTVAQDELLVMLSFDESNGTYALDKSGNDHHAKLIDQASRVNGKFGYALSFDGDNDGLAFSKVEFMDSPDSFSIAFWFNRHTDINGTENQTNHGVNNLMLGQSSASDNDNLEIGSEGTELEIYLDSVAELKMLLTQPRGHLLRMVIGTIW